MSHISTPTGISIMVFYSLVTFFISPYILKDYTSQFQDPCMVGMIIGFIISMFLWHFVGKKYAMAGGKKN